MRDQAALGQTHFTPAAIHLVEKRAFELALARAEPAEISTLLSIALKSRDTTTRERMAEVQKQKLALKQKAFALNQHGLDENRSKQNVAHCTATQERAVGESFSPPRKEGKGEGCLPWQRRHRCVRSGKQFRKSDLN